MICIFCSVHNGVESINRNFLRSIQSLIILLHLCMSHIMLKRGLRASDTGGCLEGVGASLICIFHIMIHHKRSWSIMMVIETTFHDLSWFYIMINHDFESLPTFTEMYVMGLHLGRFQTCLEALYEAGFWCDNHEDLVACFSTAQLILTGVM